MPSQLRAAGIHVDEKPHKINGNQCIIINKSVVIPLTYIHGKMVFKVRVPTADELEVLPMYGITPLEGWEASHEKIVEFDMMKFSDPWDQDENDYLLQRRSHIQRGIFTQEELLKWSKALHIQDLHFVSRTLRATTQLAVIKVDYASPLKHHMKRRFPQLRHRRFNDTVCTDTLVDLG